MSWDGRRVLVTGAGGFIGSHLAERLVREGARVRALVRYNARDSRGWLDQSPLGSELEVVAGDIADGESVRRVMEGMEVVFHLAALIAIPYSYDAPRSYVRTNLEGTLNVLQAAREMATERVIHTSTSEVYGTARSVPIAESHPLQGQSPYAASKIAADKMAEAFHLSFGLPVVTVRPFNTYGPRQSARAIVPTIVTQALAGRTIRLGNLQPTRDLNFVGDVVAGFLRAASVREAIGETINLGSGREIAIGDLARLLVDMIHPGLELGADPLRVRPPASEVDRLLADSSKARKLLGWAPEVALEEGLRTTADWIAENLESYRPGAYVV